ncbi:ATP-grasp fold amidoligase family protein [Acetobacterium bakii]|uniref:Glycosyl transferase n=1 Tax=Acetobacterium bakii TaxID=52689 RepID=A0A0L6U116_9FIRM|nr:ATP-grasp fold amidoligase family protein [Acetobacterium bakii]KNZ42032.1 glycosyl transferase [Acetobacterium bakii]
MTGKKKIPRIKASFLHLWHLPAIQFFVPDRFYLKLQYRHYFGKELNLDNPVTFNEKLQWLKLYDRKPEYTQMVDKYEVKNYIKETIGADFLIPLLGVYNNFDDIDFAVLPDQFVLKPNHTSGNVYICRDKSTIDYQQLKSDVDGWLKRQYFWVHREWPYKNVKPRIICEQFISENDTVPDDYKVLCFNGKAKLIEVHSDRFGNHHQDFYNGKWHKMKISQGFNTSDQRLEKPRAFDQMIAMSETLAREMNHVRIDWFIVQDKLYFGEITFFDGAGFEPFDDEENDMLLGNFINLPIKN